MVSSCLATVQRAETLGSSRCSVAANTVQSTLAQGLCVAKTIVVAKSTNSVLLACLEIMHTFVVLGGCQKPLGIVMSLPAEASGCWMLTQIVAFPVTGCREVAELMVFPRLLGTAERQASVQTMPFQSEDGA